MSTPPRHRPDTVLAHAGLTPDARDGSVVAAWQPSATFARDGDYALRDPRYTYARYDSPSWETAERLLAELEQGADARLFASGTAAGAAVVQALRPGDRIVAPRVMYHGLRAWMIRYCATFGLDLAFFDATESGALERTLSEAPTALLWIETPCNPTWDVIDIAAAVALGHAAGARVVVDSTVATPLLTQPLTLGADIVFHSATKYLNGHSDVVAGVAVCREHDAFWMRVIDVRSSTGSILGSFEAWLLQRGLRTLALRVRAACGNALAIAQHFDGHPAVHTVLYPGLPSHPGHAVAVRQMRGGFGGMLSLRVAGGRDAALAAATRCRVFLPATSLGGVESLIEHRASIEGPDSPVPDDLLRLSVGIEAVDDLIADLEHALAG
ncbi:MAG: PLP-dependent aspartate aminotransferase family protein [Pseudomonadota bacterium]